MERPNAENCQLSGQIQGGSDVEHAKRQVGIFAHNRRDSTLVLELAIPRDAAVASSLASFPAVTYFHSWESECADLVPALILN